MLPANGANRCRVKGPMIKQSHVICCNESVDELKFGFYPSSRLKQETQRTETPQTRPIPNFGRFKPAGCRSV